ncbi:hypothetical protein [Micromonospora sp. LOL_021]
MSTTIQALILTGGTPAGWCQLLTARPRARRPVLAGGQFAPGS